MSATTAPSVPTTPPRVPARLFLHGAFFTAIACWGAASVLRPDLGILALGLVLLVTSTALLFYAFREPVPRRLTPVGLTRGFAVKLAGDSLLVGRLPCCPVEIPLPTVSSHHCRLIRRGTRWFVEDLDSRNGTFVNDRRVCRKRLRVGDKISIGDLSFRVE